MLKTALGALALAALSVTPARSIEVTRSLDIAAPPAKIWQMVGDFCGIDRWHPAVEDCETSTQGKTTQRRLSLKGGGRIFEILLARDDGKMTYTYAITESPLPVADYKATISVMPSSRGSTVKWSGIFKAKGAPDDEAEDMIAGLYDAGLKSLSERATDKPAQD